jgi:hypothetical protein
MKRVLALAASLVIGITCVPRTTLAQVTSELFIACHDASKVTRLDVLSNTLTDPFVAPGSGGLNIATGVTFGPDANVYVTGRDNSQILRYSPSGEFIDVFVDVASSWLFDSRFGPDRNLYVLTNSTVLRYDQAGAPCPSTGQAGAIFAAGSYSGNLRGLTFGSDGAPFVATDGGKIYRLDPVTGNATEFATGPGFHGLAFGPSGDLFAACPFSGQVVRFDGTTGSQVSIFASELGYVMGIAFGPEGDPYVSSGFLGLIYHLDGTDGTIVDAFPCGYTGGYGPCWITFRPDTTPPELYAIATPNMLWPPNGRMRAVEVSGVAVEEGVGQITGRYKVTDEYGLVQPEGTFTVSTDEAFAFTVVLQASRRGNDRDGRQYLIAITVTNSAGQSTGQTIEIRVPHDRGHCGF